eukprot:SAG31_NODE_13007_length_900_cov_1.078652_1_plen_84_part_00
MWLMMVGGGGDAWFGLRASLLKGASARGAKINTAVITAGGAHARGSKPVLRRRVRGGQGAEQHQLQVIHNRRFGARALMARAH